MIPFIFFISMIVVILLIISFVIQSYALGMISSMAMVVIGVHILSSGMEGIVDFLTEGLGIIFAVIGLYIFINGSLQQIKEF